MTARTPGLWRTIALDCKQEEGTYLAVESPLSFWWEPWPNKDASEKEAAFIVEACNSHDTLTAENARLSGLAANEVLRTARLTAENAILRALLQGSIDKINEYLADQGEKPVSQGIWAEILTALAKGGA